MARATRAQALGTAVTLLAFLLPIFAGAALLQKALGSSPAPPGAWQGLGLAIGALVASAAVCGAISGRRRAHEHWPRLWDDLLGLPQTVESLAAVHRHRAASAWIRQFEAIEVPLPGPSRLAEAFPVPWRPLRSAFFLTAGLLVLHGLLPALTAPATGRGAGGVASAPPARHHSDGTQSLLELAGEELSPKIRAQLAALAQKQLGARIPLPLEAQIETELEQWRNRARAQVRERLRAADLLEPFADTAEIARWIRKGGAGPKNLELSAASQQRIRTIAADLELSPELASALGSLADQEITAPDSVMILPKLPDAWNDARTAMQWFRAIQSNTQASFSESGLASGGQDSARAPVNQDSPPDPTSVSESANDPAAPPGIRLAPGQVTDEQPTPNELVRTGTQHELDLLEIMTRPEIEQEWFEVIECYLRLQNETREASQRKEPR